MLTVKEQAAIYFQQSFDANILANVENQIIEMIYSAANTGNSQLQITNEFFETANLNIRNRDKVLSHLRGQKLDIEIYPSKDISVYNIVFSGWDGK